MILSVRGATAVTSNVVVMYQISTMLKCTRQHFILSHIFYGTEKVRVLYDIHVENNHVFNFSGLSFSKEKVENF